MAYNITPYALASLTAAIVNLLLGYIVFKKRPHHPLNRIFCCLIIFVGVLWCMSEFMLWSTQDPGAADFWAKLSWTPLFLASSVILHLIFTMMRKELSKADKTKLRAIYLIAIALIVLNFTTDTLISGAHKEYWGYSNSFGPLFKPVYLYLMLVFFYGMSLLYRKYRTTENSIERIQIKYASVGISAPVVIGSVTQVVLPFLGYTPIPISSAGTIIMQGLIAYAIIRYNLLVITPTTEDDARTKPKYSLELKTYLIPAGEDEKAMDMYVDQIIHGRQGLCVTTKEPAGVRRKYRIAKTPIIWLTEREAGHSSIPPDDLEQLTLHLKDFFNNSEDGSIVLLDGVDDLIDANGFARAYEMVDELNGETSKTKTSLIIPLKGANDLELIHLQLAKDDIEKEIQFAKKRFHKQEIDEEGFREIVKDFEKQLIKLDLEMSKMERKKSGKEMEIIE